MCATTQHCHQSICYILSYANTFFHRSTKLVVGLAIRLYWDLQASLRIFYKYSKLQNVTCQTSVGLLHVHREDWAHTCHSPLLGRPNLCKRSTNTPSWAWISTHKNCSGQLCHIQAPGFEINSMLKRSYIFCSWLVFCHFFQCSWCSLLPLKYSNTDGFKFGRQLSWQWKNHWSQSNWFVTADF